MIPMRRPGVRLPACGPRRLPDLWTIVLAAGGARRFGRNKLLLQAGGESLPRRFFGPIRRLRGDQGARRLLREGGPGVTPVEMPTAAQDLDAPGDLETFRRVRRRLDR
jgi:CTP:molybdopterin cytidylyltransferase MocA